MNSNEAAAPDLFLGPRKPNQLKTLMNVIQHVIFTSKREKVQQTERQIMGILQFYKKYGEVVKNLPYESLKSFPELQNLKSDIGLATKNQPTNMEYVGTDYPELKTTYQIKDAESGNITQIEVVSILSSQKRTEDKNKPTLKSITVSRLNFEESEPGSKSPIEFARFVFTSAELKPENIYSQLGILIDPGQKDKSSEIKAMFGKAKEGRKQVFITEKAKTNLPSQGIETHEITTILTQIVTPPDPFEISIFANIPIIYFTSSKNRREKVS